MKTIASIRKTITVQNDVPRIRTEAGKSTCWYHPQTSPSTTIAMTPET